MNILEKKETKLAAIAVGIILIIFMAVTLFNQNNLKQTRDSLVHEAGQELVFNVKDYFDVDDEAAAEITFDASKVNTTATGEYEATANYKGKKYTIKVTVVDTTAPKVTFAHRYVFANDAANVDFASMFESVTDASESTAKLIRFERKGNLSVMDEKALKSLTDEINTYEEVEDLKAIGTADVPTEEGIYRAVMEIADVHGNAAYEEIVLVLDKTGAKIEDTPDKVIKVSKDELSGTPAIDKSEYSISDNVDGKIAADDIMCELELRDEAKHEWLVHVSYTDRAGNESKADFLIKVEEGTQSEIQSGSNGGVTTTPDSGKNESSNQGANTGTNTGNSTGNGTGNNTGNTNSSEQTQNQGTTPSTKPTPDTGNSGNGGTTNQGGNTGNSGTTNQGGNTDNSGSTSQNKPTYSGKYDVELIPQEDGSFYVNTSGDEWEKTPEWEEEDHISPYEQAVIDAGYGKVVDFGNGQYAVLTHGDGLVNGKSGGDILREYLAGKDLEPQNVSGGWINSDNDWYWYIARNVREKDPMEDYWEDGEIEWID